MLIRPLLQRTRAAKRTLCADEAWLRTVYDGVNDAIFVHDSDTGLILDTNQKACEMYGYSRDELMSLHITDLSQGEAPFGEQDAGAWIQKAKTAGPQIFEWQAKHQDGHLFWVEVNLREASVNGQSRVLAAVRDISQRKLAEASLARWAVELRDLYAASLDINAQTDMSKLLPKVVERATALTGIKQGGLYLLRPDQTLELVVARDLSPEYLGVRLQLGEGLAGRVAQNGMPLMVEDYQQWDGRAVVFDKANVRRILSVPLKTRNRIIGVLNLFDTEHTGLFTDDEVRLLSLFTDQAAVAVDNAQLYEEAQQRAEQLATMNEIGHAISTLQDLDSVLKIIYRQVQRVVPVDSFYICLHDPESDQLSFPIVYDMGIRYREASTPRTPGMWIDHVMKTGLPFMLHRTAAELLTPVEDRLSVGDPSRKSASILIVPLWQRERVAGVMSVQSYTLNVYNDHHAEILVGIGIQAMIAIENAKLFTAARQELAERERAEQALRVSEARFRALIENASDMILILTAEGIVKYASPSIQRIMGYTPEALTGQNILTLLHPLDAAQMAAAWSTVLPRSAVQADMLRVRIRHADGTWHIHEGVGRNLLHDPAVASFVINARDVTERVQQESEREKLIAELEAKNTELEHFTYTISHDLKSPLITIGGFVGFLQKDALAGLMERVKVDVVYINDALAKMQQLLDELLELARVGRRLYPPEEVLFEELAQEAVALVRGRIEARGVEVEIVPGLFTLYGDRARLVKVVQHLVDNACKFMGTQPQPRIEIGARQGETGLVFYVRDNGIGVEAQYRDQVFGLFDKLDPTSEGTGIGLALAKRIIETHGGKIWVESEGPGCGSTFCFTLPSAH
ncbi:MAG TPA: PAS domain S-box protein [Anaerolineae bacterium]|nr:PAS domain S-box protein [Anaerolineae bacterium]HQI84556.1 PAS domain S-box protein [Anaerolineae bacterium]